MSDFRERYGPVALVTGASSGIGRAFADELAARGLDLVLITRRIERLEAIADELSGAHGIRVTTIQADLAVTDASARLAADTAALDIGLVISNAGFSIKGDHAGNRPAQMIELLMANLTSSLFFHPC